MKREIINFRPVQSGVREELKIAHITGVRQTVTTLVQITVRKKHLPSIQETIRQIINYEKLNRVKIFTI